MGSRGRSVEKSNLKSKQSGFLFFSIRSKIIFCFLVPVIFMIIIGVSAYHKAAEGMREKYQDSTMQTLQMATEYVEMGCSFIKSEAAKYAFNGDLAKYYKGLYQNDPIAQLSIQNSTNSDIRSVQVSNPFISNMHIITKDGINMFSTKSSTAESGENGILEKYMDTVSADAKTVVSWIDSHPLLDEYLSLNKKADEYILAYEMMSQSDNACIVIDVKTSAIREFLEKLDLGEGSIVGFVTSGGKEVICEKLAEGEESRLTGTENVFFGQDFFADINAEDNGQGCKKVNYLGKSYLFLYNVGPETGAAVCALVPAEVITGQAQEIKRLTILLVILASIVVSAVGMIIVAGIQSNMKHISGKLLEVAQGDLTVEVAARSHDEFRGLAASATNMIINTKKLVNRVKHAIGQLEVSAGEVEQASGIIYDYSQDITQAITDIHEGMSRQSRHAQECVTKTDVLSNEIQNVCRGVEKMERIVDETEKMINRGMEIIQVLGERAEQTTEITETVGASIESLRQKSEIINSFVGTITNISEQTNLLSLNASIEAARAGEFGRGFAVVAEEIRKLADESAKAAGEIHNNVEHINVQTVNSVASASQARKMVVLQGQAVREVVDVFREMQHQMKELVDGLEEIVVGTEQADRERNDAVAAVKNISDIIEKTADSAETVRDVANRLLESMENLNKTADGLGENMDGLKTEIFVFKI